MSFIRSLMEGEIEQNMNNFYVYEWFNVGSGEVFYVGKGKGNRYKNIKQRNKYFISYYNKYKCDVRKVQKNLTEDEAFDLEIELISNYRKINQCKCNLSNGGEGATFSEGSWNDLFRKLQYYSCISHSTNIMENEEEYLPHNLKNKTVEELQELYDDLSWKWEGIKFFNSLEVYDENGNLNIGWECFDN